MVLVGIALCRFVRDLRSFVAASCRLVMPRDRELVSFSLANRVRGPTLAAAKPYHSLHHGVMGERRQTCAVVIGRRRAAGGSMQSPGADAVRPTRAVLPTVHRQEGSCARRV